MIAAAWLSVLSNTTESRASAQPSPSKSPGDGAVPGKNLTHSVSELVEPNNTQM